MREIRYAFRRLRSSPMFTIAATLTLAIAIGATASVFGVVDGVLLKAFPLSRPGPRPDHLGEQPRTAPAAGGDGTRQLLRLSGAKQSVHGACRIGE